MYIINRTKHEWKKQQSTIHPELKFAPSLQYFIALNLTFTFQRGSVGVNQRDR